ncbi:MAG: NAD(P)-dependent oxidoreductase [Nanoarchaeota archaeon]|nr:NAD(P)-dependent oxidoreductase [Nanoarchaeota archaeon]
MKAAFYETKDISEEHITKELADINCIFINEPLNEHTIHHAHDADIISTVVQSKLTKETLQQLTNLKLIATRSTGYDHIDLPTCKEKKITVGYAPDYGTQAVAEFSIALMLRLTKLHTLPSIELSGKTLGIIGTGRIGKNVIALAKQFNMRIIAYDINQDHKAAQEYNYTYTSLETLLKEADIISIHAMLTKENHHLINKETIKLLKPTAYIINTGRGALVQTEALLEALEQKRIAGAALDVWEEEQEPDHIAIQHLKQLPNAILTPHIASKTQEALQRRTQTTINNIRAYLNNQPMNITQP